MLIGLAIMAAAMAAPTPEAEALGARLAATGLLATLLPMIAGKEIGELVAQHPELSAPEQARLRADAEATLAAARTRIEAALGHEYAVALSPADLKALVAFNESPPAIRYRAAVPMVTFRGLASLGKFDFKAQVLKAFCAETGKLCAR